MAPIFVPNAQNRRNAFDSWDSHSTTDMNGWQEPLNGFAPNSHGRRVWSSARTSLNVKVKSQKSKVKVNRDKKRTALTTPLQCGRNGTASLHITSRKQQARRFHRWRGVSSPACVVRALSLAGYRWALPRISSSYCRCYSAPQCSRCKRCTS